MMAKPETDSLLCAAYLVTSYFLKVTTPTLLVPMRTHKSNIITADYSNSSYNHVSYKVTIDGLSVGYKIIYKSKYTSSLDNNKLYP